MIGRLRSEIDQELAEYGFRKRDLDRLIERETRKVTLPIELEGCSWNEEEVIAEDNSS